MAPWLERTHAALEPLFRDAPIVLVDVGASGAPPESWRELAAYSCYLGFDPDRRELVEDDSFGFRRFVMIDKAVSATSASEVEFYLTASPYCSSTLPPKPDNVSQYSFTELFEVKGRTTVPAQTLDAVLERLGLHGIDWLKLDTQGTDLDIYNSLATATRDRMLALDIEPGVIDFYHGENTFAPAHAQVLQEGYWLSHALMQEFPRVSAATRARLAPFAIDFTRLPGSPTAIEATYLRTTAHLESHRSPLRDYACLWLFAMLGRRYGFALELALAIGERCSDPAIAELLLQETIATLRAPEPAPPSRLMRTARAMVPEPLLPYARRILAAVRGRG